MLTSRTFFLTVALFTGLSTTVPLSVAQADDTTTTTTTTEHHDTGPGTIIEAPARAAGTIVDSVVGARPEGCTHKSVTKTDEDTGESVTKSRTDCN